MVIRRVARERRNRVTPGNREAVTGIVWVAILDRRDMTERQGDRSGIETHWIGVTFRCE